MTSCHNNKLYYELSSSNFKLFKWTHYTLLLQKSCWILLNRIQKKEKQSYWEPTQRVWIKRIFWMRDRKIVLRSLVYYNVNVFFMTKKITAWFSYFGLHGFQKISFLNLLLLSYKSHKMEWIQFSITKQVFLHSNLK